MQVNATLTSHVTFSYMYINPCQNNIWKAFHLPLIGQFPRMETKKRALNEKNIKKKCEWPAEAMTKKGRNISPGLHIYYSHQKAVPHDAYSTRVSRLASLAFRNRGTCSMTRFVFSNPNHLAGDPVHALMLYFKLKMKRLKTERSLSGEMALRTNTKQKSPISLSW